MAHPAPAREAPPSRQREFLFRPEDFEALRALIKRTTGIHLADSKQELVYGRLSRRLRNLGLRSFAEYRELLESDEGEVIEFCNAMTTNLTAFFREAHHFDHLRDAVLVPLRTDGHGSRRLRVWSAACSTGEEPYSIAMTVCEAIPEWARWDIKILATDIDSQVLDVARRGIYPADRVRAVGERRLARHFDERGDGRTRSYAVKPELKSLITFKQLNLTHELPMKGRFEAIFCRNVIIYFDKQTQRDLFGRIAVLQKPGTVLFLGHSESLFRVSEDYTLLGRTIYRRDEPPSSAAMRNSP